MYIAVHRVAGRHKYTIRESCRIDGRMTCRDLFDLGSDPSAFIQYSGTNAFYFNETLEDSLISQVSDYDADELEDIFWPWLRPDVRYAVETFRGRGSKTGFKRLSRKEKDHILSSVHSFDKRRAHYLKFGSMDQGAVENMSAVLFKNHVNKSRDELEQYFLRQEQRLKARELKSYVYTIFDLQRFFQGFMAKTMPHALDQNRVDEYFEKEFCRLNKELFDGTRSPHPYMVRYVIMFFDHLYADTTLLDDFTHAFMSRRRQFRQPKPGNPVSVKNALVIFGISSGKIKTMDKKQLTKLYRKKARAVHPDTGGSNEQFVELNNAFESLLERISQD